ncbi:hypothetical protein [Streptomyces venezuelae]|uniref:hypothetical protein n=1 Tax=Streptomyces venezuelae TaxID=54571 RepID=UPI0037B7EA09
MSSCPDGQSRRGSCQVDDGVLGRAAFGGRVLGREEPPHTVGRAPLGQGRPGARALAAVRVAVPGLERRTPLSFGTISAVLGVLVLLSSDLGLPARAGLALYGFSLSVLVRAALGVNPWGVLYEGDRVGEVAVGGACAGRVGQHHVGLPRRT